MAIYFYMVWTSHMKYTRNRALYSTTPKPRFTNQTFLSHKAVILHIPENMYVQKIDFNLDKRTPFLVMSTLSIIAMLI